MNKKSFAGDKKVGRSLLTDIENKFKYWAVPRIPSCIETYHLTLMTLLWSLINIIIGLYMKGNLQWLWGVSLMIVLQYITDLFDGELGRQRKTGLIKWGFYMDHFLDYIFLCTLVFVGYRLSPRGLETWYVALLIILGAFMVNSFLAFAATNEFKIYYYGIGPTETRVFFILINVYIIIFGTDYFFILLPLAVIICLLALFVNTWQIQNQLWGYDMEQLAADQADENNRREG